MSSIGHWEYDGTLDPEANFGFVYLIHNLKTGRKYIGKKQYYSYKKNKKFKEMDWRGYTGSSKELNSDIQDLGKDSFQFLILKECKTRGGLTYIEANMQHKLDALTERLEDGTRVYYNKQIGAIRYVPKEF